MKHSAPTLGDRVQVYRNLNVAAWSVRDPSTRLVLAHTPFAELRGVEFRVQTGSLRTVLATGVRRVHAYAVGELARVGDQTRRRGAWQRFTYNPFRVGAFTLADVTPLVLLDGAERVRFDDDGAWLQGPRVRP